jgi:DNA-binding NtrC family response regulator
MAKICKVLVVDDHDDVRTVLGTAVEHAGYRFTLAKDATEARRAIENDAFEVAIIDATLPPWEDGHALAAFAASRGIGVIMISGDPRQTEPLKQGRHAYLRKPFRLSDLLRLIEAVLAEIRAECQPAPDRNRAVGSAD